MSNLTIIGDRKPAMDEVTIKRMHKLANGFANERLSEFRKLISDNLIESCESGIDGLSKALGKIIAISYSKGYADCVENQDVRKVIF